jgi:hypothetical protein
MRTSALSQPTHTPLNSTPTLATWFSAPLPSQPPEAELLQDTIYGLLHGKLSVKVPKDPGIPLLLERPCDQQDKCVKTSPVLPPQSLPRFCPPSLQIGVLLRLLELWSHSSQAAKPDQLGVRALRQDMVNIVLLLEAGGAGIRAVL